MDAERRADDRAVGRSDDGRINERETSTAAGVRTLLLGRTSGQSAGIDTPSICVTRNDGERAARRDGGRPSRNDAESPRALCDSDLFRGFGATRFRFFAVGLRTGRAAT